MIYICNENEEVINTYSRDSGIKVILEYVSFAKLSGLEREEINENHFFVACPDMQYAFDYIETHEYIADIIDTKGRLREKSVPAFFVSDGDYVMDERALVDINWNTDYYFYPNKNHIIT